jgi:hypothetical protein
MVKIARNRNSTWLIRRQLWVLTFAFYLYATLPIDAWIMRFNVSRILAGDLAPTVQITEHPTSTEGILQLSPLLKADDPLIRDGIRALLSRTAAQRQGEPPRDWTRFQFAEEALKQQLAALQTTLSVDRDDNVRQQEWDALRAYAFQWY